MPVDVLGGHPFRVAFFVLVAHKEGQCDESPLADADLLLDSGIGSDRLVEGDLGHPGADGAAAGSAAKEVETWLILHVCKPIEALVIVCQMHLCGGRPLDAW